MFNKWCLSFTRKIGFTLFFLIIYSSGFYLIQKQAELVICKYQFKKTLLRDISVSNLKVFKVSTDFDNDEFEYNDIWYDVVKSKLYKDYKIVYCVEDSNESEIHKELSGYVENWYHDKFHDIPNQISFYNFLLDSKYINDNSSINLPSYFFQSNKKIFPALLFHFQFYFESSFKPPILIFNGVN